MNRSPQFTIGEKTIKFPNIFNHNQSISTKPKGKPVKSKINLDSNYQLMKSKKTKQSLIKLSDEIDASENLMQHQQDQMPVQKVMLDRKMLTSRDQETRWVNASANIALNRH